MKTLMERLMLAAGAVERRAHRVKLWAMYRNNLRETNPYRAPFRLGCLLVFLPWLLAAFGLWAFYRLWK